MPERIDAGYEGILVELYGSDRGVNDVSMVTGMIWYNIFTQAVFEYPTFVQTVDYLEFTTNAKDIFQITTDKNNTHKMLGKHYGKHETDYSGVCRLA